MPPLDGPRAIECWTRCPWKHADRAVVHLDRDRDGELALRVAEHFAGAGVETEVVRGALELQPRKVEGVQVLGVAGGGSRSRGAGRIAGLGFADMRFSFTTVLVAGVRRESIENGRALRGRRTGASSAACRARAEQAGREDAAAPGCRRRRAPGPDRRRPRAAGAPAARWGRACRGRRRPSGSNRSRSGC